LFESWCNPSLGKHYRSSSVGDVDLKPEDMGVGSRIKRRWDLVNQHKRGKNRFKHQNASSALLEQENDVTRPPLWYLNGAFQILGPLCPKHRHQGDARGCAPNTFWSPNFDSWPPKDDVFWIDGYRVPSGKRLQSFTPPWKDPPFFMGKLTISTGPFSIATFVYQRVDRDIFYGGVRFVLGDQQKQSSRKNGWPLGLDDDLGLGIAPWLRNTPYISEIWCLQYLLGSKIDSDLGIACI
jgi:hypothetical protein